MNVKLSVVFDVMVIARISIIQERPMPRSGDFFEKSDSWIRRLTFDLQQYEFLQVSTCNEQLAPTVYPATGGGNVSPHAPKPQGFKIQQRGSHL
jgi:hypothetical protein